LLEQQQKNAVFLEINFQGHFFFFLVKKCATCGVTKLPTRLCTMDFPMETMFFADCKSSAQAHSVDIRSCM